MKKTIFLRFAVMALVAVFVFSLAPQTTYAQLSNKLEKKLSKERNKQRV